MLFVSIFATCITAHPNYMNLIPNGRYYATSGHYMKPGHLSLFSSSLDSFGKDFVTAGNQWNEWLCKQDSNRNGLTNGEELGDPFCTWRYDNKTQLRYTGISNPGEASIKPNYAAFWAHIILGLLVSLVFFVGVLAQFKNRANFQHFIFMANLLSLSSVFAQLTVYDFKWSSHSIASCLFLLCLQIQTHFTIFKYQFDPPLNTIFRVSLLASIIGFYCATIFFGIFLMDGMWYSYPIIMALFYIAIIFTCIASGLLYMERRREANDE